LEFVAKEDFPQSLVQQLLGVGGKNSIKSQNKKRYIFSLKLF